MNEQIYFTNPVFGGNTLRKVEGKVDIEKRAVSYITGTFSKVGLKKNGCLFFA